MFVMLFLEGECLVIVDMSDLRDVEVTCFRDLAWKVRPSERSELHRSK